MFAIRRTKAAVRDHRTRLDISLGFVDVVSRWAATVHDEKLLQHDELLPQIAEVRRQVCAAAPEADECGHRGGRARVRASRLARGPGGLC